MRKTGDHRKPAGKILCGLALLLALAPAARAADAEVSLVMNGQPAVPGDYKKSDVQSLVISNSLLSITFGRDTVGDFSATSVLKDGTELAHNLHGLVSRDVDRDRTFYLDSGAGRGHLIVGIVRIIKNTPEMAHFAVIDNTSPIYFEHHFILCKGLSGVYGYVIVKTKPGSRGGGETRTMYRFDRDILDYAYCAERTGQQLKYADLQKLPKLQDETWKLPDGTIYQKYDYSAYYSESAMWGHYGHGFGIFFMPVGKDYYAGGPLRQELVVHQDALILNYLGGGHYGGGGPAPGINGQKMFGPWLLYFNTGATPDAIIADAKQRAADEQTKWPYQWVDEPLYPLRRTTVTGQLKVTDGRSAGLAEVVLARPGGDVYTQGGDFIYYVKADDSGKFTLPNVRPGTYALYAWSNQGPITDQLEKDGVQIQGDTPDLGAVEWTPPHHENFLWQIGKADRMSGEFKYGNQLRNIKWISMVPADLTYTIGKSNSAEDWYYAQGKIGHWDVNFDLDKTYTAKAFLTIALAGGGGGSRVVASVNGTDVITLAPPNDASTYRSALRSGKYGLKIATFPASLLKTGANTVRFNMTSAGTRWNGIMYDTIVLEAD
ncbi:MAG: polysaccharide lyase family protein [Planctomycetota bacterium]|nr:polysaccharide lyase family protein [Planctomycetota bacterium]